jgi:hypothetical protein
MHNNAGSSNGSSEAAQFVVAVPLRADLFHKVLSAAELIVLLAMLEIGDSTGQTLYPSVRRIAHYTNLSIRTVKRVLHGEARDPKRDPKKKKARKRAKLAAAADLSLSLFSSAENPEECGLQTAQAKSGHQRARYAGLVQRRILVELAPANGRKHMPTCYRLQVDTIPDKPLPERWQRGNLIPASQNELEKWINHNRGSWNRILRELQNKAEARVGLPMPANERAAFMVAVAREEGMPYRLAQLCVKMGRS